MRLMQKFQRKRMLWQIRPSCGAFQTANCPNLSTLICLETSLRGPRRASWSLRYSHSIRRSKKTCSQFHQSCLLCRPTARMPPTILIAMKRFWPPLGTKIPKSSATLSIPRASCANKTPFWTIQTHSCTKRWPSTSTTASTWRATLALCATTLKCPSNPFVSMASNPRSSFCTTRRSSSSTAVMCSGPYLSTSPANQGGRRASSLYPFSTPRRPLIWPNKTITHSGNAGLRFMWSKARPKQGRIPIPIVASNIKLEFTEFYESSSAAFEKIQCPRCSTTVTEKHGICRSCGENAYQCRQCRAIHYEDLRAFLCVDCGFCRYGKFDFSFHVKRNLGADRIFSAEDRKLCLENIEKETKNAHKSYQQLVNIKKPLQKIVHCILDQ
eukprot:05023_2